MFNRARAAGFRVRTIRTKLLAYAAAVLFVPTIIYGALAYVTARAAITPVLATELSNDTASVKVAVQELLAGQIQNVRTWARLDPVSRLGSPESDRAISRFLQQIAQDYGVFLDVFAVDDDGVCRASSWKKQIGKSYREQVDTLLGENGPTPKVEYSVEHDAFYIGLAERIVDPADPTRATGTLVAMLDRAILDSLVHPQRGHGPVDLLLLDGDGRILAGSRHAYVGDTLPHWSGSKSAAVASADGRGSYTIESPNGPKLIVSESQLEAHRALPTLDWKVVAALPENLAFAPVRAVRNWILLFGSVVTAIGLLLARLLSSNLVWRVKQLTATTKRIAAGGVLERIPEPTSDDEIAELARSFQTMVENVSIAHEEVVQSAKLAFLGELAAGIAHEIRTPLGIIKNSAQLLERSAIKSGASEDAEFASFIREESDRLNATVDDLLSFARPARIETEHVDINRLVERAVNFLSSEAKSRKVQIRTELAATLPDAECDGRQIYQVFLNLIMNSIQACAFGGTVVVTTEAAGEGIECAVRDDGSGISNEISETLFTPFVSKRKGGIGLGLAIVKRIVAAHGGMVEGCNLSSGGACFRMWIPRRAGTLAGRPAPLAADDGREGKR